MKKSIRSALLSSAVAVGATLMLSFAAAPANAATAGAPPQPSASGGTVTICQGTDLSLNDPVTGSPLALDEQQRLIDHLTYKCQHPNMPAHGSSLAVAGSRMVSPNKTISGVGELIAHLVITTGSVEWWTSASSMSWGPTKTLDCEYRVNNGTWTGCGSAGGSGSSLTTRTNGICYPPGTEVEVEAWLHLGGADYWDDAWGKAI